MPANTAHIPGPSTFSFQSPFAHLAYDAASASLLSAAAAPHTPPTPDPVGNVLDQLRAAADSVLARASGEHQARLDPSVRMRLRQEVFA